MNEKIGNKFRPSLSTLILTGLALGIATGLFLGEMAAGLEIVGKAYIGLIQMSILPYMVLSLIGGIGRLSYQKARTLAMTAGLVLLGSWVLAFLIIFILPLAFPDNEAGTFYSHSLVQAAEVNFIDLYIPSNPFSSLARTVVPAAAVFSVFVGIALIGVEKKQTLLEVLDSATEAMTRVAKIVVNLTPIGVFAITANATGTMTIEEFGRLQAYIVTFISATLLLTFWVLPGLVATLTPFGYREVLRTSRDALVTGFVTANLFIVLPLLVEGAKRLFEEKRLHSEDSDSFVEVLVPSSFNFPNIGKLLTLLFVLFAGWYTGKSIEVSQYPMFSTLGLFTLFGGVDLALPFLLDQLRIPADMYQLYVVTGVANSWFATLIAVMNLFAFTIVATCAATGSLRINPVSLSRFAIITVVLFTAVIGASRFGLSMLSGASDGKHRVLAQMEADRLVPATLYTEVPENLLLPDTRKPRLAQILERGTLRVGYTPGGLPFSYLNDNGELVGFDIELAHRLARELGVTLEFIPWGYDTLAAQLDRGEFDIVAGGMRVTGERLKQFAFSDPYLEVTMAFVVKDHLRHDFTSAEKVDWMPGIRIGIVSQDLARLVESALPQTEIVALDSYTEFFEGNQHKLDGIIISAESGSAWTVMYPQYSVAIITPHITTPMAITMSQNDPAFTHFINSWLESQKIRGNIDRLYNRWILGKETHKKTPRWSVIRDVLHWVD
jgi:Na+/H+-dicarboxylate symporter